MPEIDPKLIVVGVLFAALIAAKLIAGRSHFVDQPVRRKRRFGRHGTMSPLNDPEAAKKAPPPPDPEEEFFGEDGKS